MTGACAQGRREMEKEKKEKEGADDNERGLPGCDYGERRASGGAKKDHYYVWDRGRDGRQRGQLLRRPTSATARRGDASSTCPCVENNNTNKRFSTRVTGTRGASLGYRVSAFLTAKMCLRFIAL